MALKPWSLPSVTANLVTDFVVPAANKDVAIIGLIVCHCGTTDAAAITVMLTTNTNTIKALVFQGSLEPGDTVHIDTKVCLAASPTPDKLRVRSTIATVSFLASGDED